MTATAWILAAAALTLFLGAAAAIMLDIWLASTGRQTISRHTLELSRRYPRATFLLLTAATLSLVFALGALYGHLVFPQELPCSCGDAKCVCPAADQ